MAFFNIYSNNEGTRFAFYDSIEHNGFIYSIGRGTTGLNRGALLLKVDLDGNIIFSKVFNINNNGISRFSNLIISNSGELIVSGVNTSTFESFICRINENDGTLLWNKFFPNTTTTGRGINSRNLIKLDQSSFIYITQYNNEHVLNKFDYSGNLFFSKNYNISSFEGISANPSGTKIVLLTNDDILCLDPLLNLVAKSKISNFENFIYCFFINDNEFIISRKRNSEGGYIILIKLNYNNIGSITNVQATKINNVGSLSTQIICGNANSVFVSVQDSINTGYSTSISKFDTNLNLIWTKRINISESQILSNSFKQLVLNHVLNNSLKKNQLLLHVADALILTDANLNTCHIENHNLSITSETKLFSQSEASINSTLKQIVSEIFIVSNINLNIVEVCSNEDPQPDLTQSTITANPTAINANGTSISQITIQLNDALGNPITTGGPYTIEILFSAGSMVVNSGNADANGQFETQLVSSTIEETSLLEFTVNNQGPSPNTATVQFIAEGVNIDISKITAFQSPHLYLQASGSNGIDSTKGRHLRWALRGVLGEKHLPKGDYANNNVNFNKPNDYVKIYKAAYRKKNIRLNLIQDTPEVVDNSNYLWIYKIEEKEFYIHFRNTTVYDQVRQTIDPMSDPSLFIRNYGSELIEVENIKEMFFAVTCNFSQRQISPNKDFNVETLSVSTNSLVANKVVSNRKTISDNELNTPLKLLFENGRAIRWQIFNSELVSLDFEFYTETIREINDKTGWVKLGDFALTLDQATAFSQLEPTAGDVNGVWQRFNEEGLVKIENYHHKWGATSEPGDRNIHQVVESYIQLSENASNPAAIEEIPLGNNPLDPEDYMEISNLDMLNFAANDYHIARMLGLGILDIDQGGLASELKSINVYVAEYYTSADLEDGLGKREVQHLFMSLPTSNLDFRLPFPLDLNHITPGVFLDGEDGVSSPLTDVDGYSHDGMSRYVSLYTDDLIDDDINTPFFVTSEEINLSIETTPVYGGLKYRLDQGDWQKPELSNDPRYYNEVPQGVPFYETRFILIPEPLSPFYTHRQTVSGTHRYRSYGINWFSRAKIGSTEISIETLIKQKNPLVPPSNTNALLIRQESPLLLTSADEQARLLSIGTNNDKTLIRLTYDYHSAHELKNYNVPMDSPWTNSQLTDDNNANNPSVLFPDNEEIFADEVDIFFRNQVPNNITGKALTVSDHGTNEILSIITTGEYEIVSTGETLTPYIAPGTEGNYVGGVFISGENQYIIHQVTQASQGPVFMVYKKEVSDSIVNGGGIPSNPPIGELEPPVLVTDGLFMAIENMQNTGSWGTPNPLNFKVKVGPGDWKIHREVIEIIDDDGEVQRMVEKTRGIFEFTTITPVNEPIEENTNDPDNPIMGFRGLYEVEFNGISLNQHPQYSSNGVSAEWYKGIVRIFTESAVSGSVPNKTRKILPVISIENIDSPNNLVVYVRDPSFDHTDPNYDTIQTGSNIKVNFYPGYKVYLYENTPFGLNEQNILPDEGEGVRYSIFGFRSQDSAGGCDPISGSCLSKISVPCLMFAQELIEAEIPKQPKGSLFATRPDFFGRSTYTLTTEYRHKPYGVLFYRSNDEALLNALYEKDKIKEIREHLEALGGNNEEYLTNRWENFLDFGELEGGEYIAYPPGEGGYKFPNPDKQSFFDWANHILAKLNEPPIDGLPGEIAAGDSRIFNFVKGAIYNAFVSLTEMPIIYQYLHDGDYQPIDKPQVIKDRNGNIIQPGGEGFEIAPMMKVIGKAPEPNETLFTDFKLDGTSNNLYFYGAKELSTQMKMSDFSPFLGPIKLVNTNAPEAPEIKRIIPVLENTVLGISPKIQLEINAYPKVQGVKKLTIYRAYTMLEAQSVQTMQLVKIVDLEDEGILDEPVWTVSDNFNDLPEIPYGDGLFYRVTVSREVKYADSLGDTVVEYAPSQASKIVASLMVEANAPQSPVLKFLSTLPDANDEIHSVSLQWAKMAYNAKYHLYKMNSQGNWAEIHKFQTNDDDIVLPLVDTDLQSDSLKLINDEGNTVYHHFKVLVENTAGMLSTEENILTVFNEDDWIEI